MRYLLLLLLFALPVKAQFVGEVGVMIASYEHVKPSFEYQLVLGMEKYDYYVWLSYEDTGIRMLGQPLADLQITSIGAGVKYPLRQNWILYIEAGYAIINVSDNDFVRDEII